MIQYLFYRENLSMQDLYILQYSFTQSNCQKSAFAIRFFHFKPPKQLRKLYQMLYITQNSDRQTQTSVNLKANHPTLLQFFTKTNVFFYIPEGQFAYVYLLNKLLTNSYLKAFVVYFSRYALQQFIPSLRLNISSLFHRKRILPVSDTTLSTSFDI